MARAGLGEVTTIDGFEILTEQLRAALLMDTSTEIRKQIRDEELDRVSTVLLIKMERLIEKGLLV